MSIGLCPLSHEGRPDAHQKCGWYCLNGTINLVTSLVPGSNQDKVKAATEPITAEWNLIGQAGASSGTTLVVPAAQLLATFPDLDWLPSGSRARLFASAEFPHVSCSASCGFISNHRGQWLLVRVASRGWDIPGGHTDPEESPKQTLIREAAEESGIGVTDPEPIGYLTIEKPDEPPAFISFYSGEACGEPQPHSEWIHEVDQAAWVEADQVITLVGERVWMPLWHHIQGL